MHLVGWVRGAVRLKLKGCPTRASSEAWEIVEAYLDSIAFPGVPLTGTCIDDLDARTHDGLRLIREEHAIIDAQIRDDHRRAREAARAR